MLERDKVYKYSKAVVKPKRRTIWRLRLLNVYYTNVIADSQVAATLTERADYRRGTISTIPDTLCFNE